MFLITVLVGAAYLGLKLFLSISQDPVKVFDLKRNVSFGVIGAIVDAL